MKIWQDLTKYLLSLLNMDSERCWDFDLEKYYSQKRKENESGF